jgi:hypothetical protein
MRPIWVALDGMVAQAASKGRPLEEGAGAAWQDLSLSSVCKPLVDRLLGYEVAGGSGKSRAAAAAKALAAQGSYMDVVKTCVNDKCCQLADEVKLAGWRRRSVSSPISLISRRP